MPQYKTTNIQNDVVGDLTINVNLAKCTRAKKMIMEQIEGSYKDVFGSLKAY